jgi:hypothetical protein
VIWRKFISLHIKGHVGGGQGYSRALRAPLLGVVYLPSKRDRYSRDLILLPLVVQTEYSCTPLHKQGGLASEKTSSETVRKGSGVASIAPVLVSIVAK